ncbi:hypothetical protein CAP42_13180 [Acinetobacter indicus]|nr:hypothetical protein VH96_06360 [Acinetobacter indicus]OUY07352.1 hypothetical protein CAP42_13180 [Acinetobacter indicus]
MRAKWLCGRFCVQASSFENYIAEKPFTDRFVQQSREESISYHKNITLGKGWELAFNTVKELGSKVTKLMPSN